MADVIGGNGNIGNAQAETQDRIKKITETVMGIYDLIDPGMSITIQWQIKPQVVSPHANIKARTIILTRPHVNAIINLISR